MRALAILITFTLLFASVVSAQQKVISKDYARAASQIIGSAMVESRAYERLEYLSDSIGARLSGSPQLDQAIQWAVATMKADGFDNVRAEPVMVPHWVRGAESAEIVAPAKHKLTILGLGGTISTPAGGITAPVVEVKSYEELEALGESVRGKIVLYNAVMRSDVSPGTAYGEAVRFRGTGAIRAAKQGAVASLIRSVTTRSLNTPHTGQMRYEEGVPKIPAAAITTENADLISRLLKRGEKVVVRLSLEAQTLPDAPSANVVAEVRGRERPDEIVLIGGHIDSWDVGTGATDDGSGCIIAWEAARLINSLNLRPRRTIRVVLFTNEENGLRGAIAYRDAHRQEFDKHVAAIEADSGAAKPLGFSFSGTDRALEMLQQMAPLLQGIGADRITKGGAGADISVLTEAGVPGLGLRPDPTHYFDLHHTEADTLDKISPIDLNLNVATMAVMTYLLADLPEPLPRE